MNSDRFSGDLAKFLHKALEIQLSDPEDQLTEEALKEIALKAGLTEDDWARICQKLDEHLQKGANFLTFGNFTEAINEFEQAAAIAPYRANILADCGSAHLGHWKEAGSRPSRDRAEEMFRKCLKIEPGHTGAAEQLSALRHPRPSRSVSARKALIAGLLGLAGVVSAWMMIPESGEANSNLLTPSIESRPQVDRIDSESSPTRIPLHGFLEIPWGTGDEEARDLLTSRTHSQYNPKESTQNRLCFDGGLFAGFEVSRFTLNFENGGFYSAQVQLKGKSKDHRKEFLTFKQMLTDKFGPPERNKEDTDVLESTWYFRVKDRPANLINLVGDEGRSGVTVLYHSPGTQSERNVQEAPPLKIQDGAKDDL